MSSYQQLIFISFLITVAQSASLDFKNLHTDAGLNIIDFTAKYGYPLESHEVETEDGYILTMHRIPHGVNNSDPVLRPPVLLMHGLFSSSMDWVNLGPGKALGLLLADAGYDVWLGNQRGNTWSKKHINYDPDEEKPLFFDFSWHKIGFYDLPAKIDYILNATNENSLFYIGHSQGTTAFFVLNSERPEYNKKIRLMQALSPIAFMGSLQNPLLRLLAQEIGAVEEFLQAFNLYEFLPHFDSMTDLSEFLCADVPEEENICLWIINIIAGIDWKIDTDFAPVIFSNFPAGSSYKQLLHYLQELNSYAFCRYDYGAEMNVEIYGQDTPPGYNISQITAPVSLYYSTNDWLSSTEDVAILKNSLPNVFKTKQIEDEKFNHADFLWATEAVELVYNYVISEIQSSN